jgi:hypothetical protein
MENIPPKKPREAKTLFTTQKFIAAAEFLQETGPIHLHP